MKGWEGIHPISVPVHIIKATCLILCYTTHLNYSLGSLSMWYVSKQHLNKCHRQLKMILKL